MRVSALRCLAVLLLLLGASEALAQCRVEGVVRAAGGAPVPEATVQLDGADYKKPLTTTSGADGRYVFEGVKAGSRVRITALRSGRLVAETYALVTLFVETVDLEERLMPATPTSTSDVLASRGTAGEIGGVVRTTGNLVVPNALVTIDATTLVAATDSAGRYRFGGLRPGIRLRILVDAAGYKVASVETIVPEAKKLDLDVVLEAIPASEEAEAATLPQIDAAAESARATVRPERLAGVPSLGPHDLFRALQFLPGVTASTERSGDLAVRGGTPDQTLVTFDGFTLYPTDHVFGGLSALNMGAVEGAAFSRGVLDAGDGGRLSGALRLAGQSNDTGRVSGSVDVSVLGLGAAVSVPLAGKGSASVAFRRSPPASSYSDVLDYFGGRGGVPARDRALRLSDGTTRAAADSAFRDLHGRLDLNVTGKDRVVFSIYDGRDDANVSRDLGFAPDTAAWVVSGIFTPPADAEVQVSDLRTWAAKGVSGAWTRRWSPAAVTTVSFGRSEMETTADRSSVLVGASTGEDYTLVSGRGGWGGFAESNTISDTTFRVDSRIGFGFDHALSIGGEIVSLDAEYLARSEVFSQSGGVVRTSGLADLFRHDASGSTTTVFAQDSWRPTSRLLVSPGARLTRFGGAGSTYLEPRVSAEFIVTPMFRVSGGWSVDHQAASRLTREDRAHGDGAFWALADGDTIAVPRARQFVGGARIEARGLLLDLTLYHRSFDDLSLVAPRLFPGVAPEAGQRLVHVGSGTSRGVEWLVQKASAWNTIWTSYTYSEVEHRFPTLEADAFPASHDQEHQFELMDTVRIGRRWSISAALVAATGRPYTPSTGVEPVWFPDGATVYQITYAAKNSERLPVYHRLDASARFDFRLGRVATALGATVFNVYDRENTWFYDHQTAGATLKATGVAYLRRTVNVFLRIGF